MWRWLIVAVVASLILSASVAADDFDEALKKLKDKDPVKRVSGLRALGKIGDMRAVQQIVMAFKDPHPRVRDKAAEALERIKDKEVLGWLREKVLQHGDREIRRYTAMAFGMGAGVHGMGYACGGTDIATADNISGACPGNIPARRYHDSTHPNQRPRILSC